MIFGTSVVSRYGYFKVVKYSYIWKIIAGGLFLLVGPMNVWMLMLYLTCDR